jgi:hypothetical protein
MGRQNDSSKTLSQLWHMPGHTPCMQPGVKLKKGHVEGANMAAALLPDFLKACVSIRTQVHHLFNQHLIRT